MELKSFIRFLAFVTQLNVVVAVPARQDYNEYAGQNDVLKRGIKTITKTRTVTVIDENAVVIVDRLGNILSTERRTPATPVVNAVPVPPPTTTSEPRVKAPQTTPDLTSTSVSAAISTRETTSTFVTTTSAAPANNNAGGSLKGFSVAYDPISANGCRNFDSDFGLLAKQGVGLIRVYDVGCNLGDVVTAASKHNVRLMLGINDIENGKLEKDLGKLISDVNSASVKFGPVDTVYICNECVQRNQPASEVSKAVNDARATLRGAGFGGSVITVDTFGKIMEDTTICSTSDYCGANIYAFFNANTASSQAGQFVQDSLKLTQNANSGKRIVITETGWPHQGQPNGKAVPSSDDQKTAIESIMGTFSSSAADVFLFQPFDASYKSPGTFGVEPFFGILNQDTGAMNS